MHLLLLSLLACGDSAPPEAPAAPEEAATKDEAPAEEAPTVDPSKYAAMFGVLEPVPVTAEEKALVDLGRQLYYENRLSDTQTMSCNTCHQLDNYGVDGEPTSPGTHGERGARNSPTSYNAFLHVAQFWDGRAADVEEQAKGPILNPGEMAMPDEATVEKILGSIPGYVEGFGKAFPGEEQPVNYENMAKAIGAFERHLVTPGDFDTFLAGDASALTAEEAKGLETFVSTGCTACHSGKLLGGTMYMKLGQVQPYETEDIGRMEFTGNEADKYFFKVPSLRNVAKTGPYFHDGSIATLEEAVSLMAKHQLGKELSDEDTASIVAFLGALTGEIDQAYVAKPKLPDGGPDTPGPSAAK